MKLFRNLLSEVEEGYMPEEKLPEIKSIDLNEYDENGEYSEEVIEEGVNDPPMVLLMRRQAIRTYPNGQKVALYYNKQYDKQIAIPYDERGIPRHVSTMSESFLSKLENCKTSRFIPFKDGSSTYIRVDEEKLVLEYMNKLKNEVRTELLENLQGSGRTFEDFVKFIKEENNK